MSSEEFNVRKENGDSDNIHPHFLWIQAACERKKNKGQRDIIRFPIGSMWQSGYHLLQIKKGQESLGVVKPDAVHNPGRDREWDPAEVDHSKSKCIIKIHREVSSWWVILYKIPWSTGLKGEDRSGINLGVHNEAMTLESETPEKPTASFLKDRKEERCCFPSVPFVSALLCPFIFPTRYFL